MIEPKRNSKKKICTDVSNEVNGMRRNSYSFLVLATLDAVDLALGSAPTTSHLHQCDTTPVIVGVVCSDAAGSIAICAVARDVVGGVGTARAFNEDGILLIGDNDAVLRSL